MTICQELAGLARSRSQVPQPCSWKMPFFLQAEDGIRDSGVTGVQTCALPIRRRRGDGDVDRRPAQAGGGALPGAGAAGDGGRRGAADRALLGRTRARPARLPLRAGRRRAHGRRGDGAVRVRGPAAAHGAARLMIRTGLGVDSHRFAPGRRLILGGVEIPHDAGLAGHSDADVLTHAVIDALLGAAGLGDIGTHFPDTEAQWKDADSLALLRDVVGRLTGDGWAIGNVDATVMLERPKLLPHRAAITAALADALGLAGDAVNVKATTGEGMGFVGRGEGAAAMAVATLECAAG